MRKTLLLLSILIVLGGSAAWLWKSNSSPSHQYRMVKIERGDLLVTVTATGTVQPVTQVQVGTQVSGTIQSLSADYNVLVKADQVVAQIDPAQYKARVDQDAANLAKAEADVGRVKASLVQAEKALKRNQDLAARDMVSDADLDAAVANYDSLIAQVKVAEATVAQSRATLQVSEVNLRYTTIKSPIDGIVIARSVDPGQTVAASLQAPTIFVIAGNLKHVQVQASVAEADIGRVFVDQDVSFTVDAYRDLKFRGKVAQIRLSPTTVQNVVTYTVIVNAENPEEKLLPGMTANAAFEIDHRQDVLKVPNAALRFTPPQESGAEEAAPAGPGREARSDASREGRPEASREGRPDGADAKADERSETPREGRASARSGRTRGPRHKLWILGPAGELKPVPVQTGVTDGIFTELIGGDLQEGQEIVAGILQEGMDSQMNNPFTPRFGGGGGRTRPR